MARVIFVLFSRDSIPFFNTRGLVALLYFWEMSGISFLFRWLKALQTE